MIGRHTAWVALLPVVLGCQSNEDEPATRSQALGTSTSQWGQTSLVHYEQTDVYGVTDDQALAAIDGFAVSNSDVVFVYDSPNSRVIVLSDHLTLVSEFGREGPGGPGDLRKGSRLLASFEKNWLAADDSTVLVFDGEAVSVFDHAGTFLFRHRTRPIGDVFALRTKGIRSSGGTLYYLLDSIDVRGTAPRRWQAWSVRNDTAALVGSMPLPEPPKGQGGFVIFSTQARPLFAFSPGFLVMSDGSSADLLRVDLKTGEQTLDSIPQEFLPDVSGDVPESEMRNFGQLLRMGGTGQRVSQLGSTAVRRWLAIRLDPDGFLWFQPRIEGSGSSNESGTPVFRLNLATGEVEEDNVPAFPDGFGSPGVYYSVGEDAETEVPVVRRFELR